MKTSPCRGCGKPIAFGTTPEGKTVPIDPRPPVYQVIEFSGDETPVRIERRFNHYVSHFATCPKASEFSGSKKKPESPV